MGQNLFKCKFKFEDPACHCRFQTELNNCSTTEECPFEGKFEELSTK
jgi:hypothetical protein